VQAVLESGWHKHKAETPLFIDGGERNRRIYSLTDNVSNLRETGINAIAAKSSNRAFTGQFELSMISSYACKTAVFFLSNFSLFFFFSRSTWLKIYIILIYFQTNITSKKNKNLRLLILFRFARNGRNIPYQFKKQNKTEQISSHFKSRSVPDFSAKFRPEHSSFVPHISFRSWKVIESNWTLFNLIN
jgi:type IV secretory pathway VirB3-like protein